MSDSHVGIYSFLKTHYDSNGENVNDLFSKMLLLVSEPDSRNDIWDSINNKLKSKFDLEMPTQVQIKLMKYLMIKWYVYYKTLSQ